MAARVLRYAIYLYLIKWTADEIVDEFIYFDRSMIEMMI